MKAIKKLFNILSKEQKAEILLQSDKIQLMAEQEASTLNDKERDRKKEKDSKCPICGDTTIVNKIARVEGSGYVSGSMSWGGGYIHGSSSTDTNEVNHCNKCGNQWKKYEKTYKWKEDILADWMNDLGTVYEGKYTFGDRTVIRLQEFSAEAIWEIGKKVASKCYSSTKENVSLSFLRTKFKSIH